VNAKTFHATLLVEGKIEKLIKDSYVHSSLGIEAGGSSWSCWNRQMALLRLSEQHKVLLT